MQATSIPMTMAAVQGVLIMGYSFLADVGKHFFEAIQTPVFVIFPKPVFES